MRVLLIEDNASTSELLSSILEARGHEVFASTDAESGLARFEESPFPLVVLDWLLPGVDGLEACRRLRAMPGGDRCVVLMVTARDRGEDLRQVLEAGADDYVAKPVDIDAMNIRLAVAERSVEGLALRKAAEARAEAAHAEVARSRDDLNSILDKFAAGAALVDRHGRLSHANASFHEFFGLSRDAATGRPWKDALRLDEQQCEALEAAAQLPEGSRDRVRTVVDDGEGSRRWLDVDLRDDPRDARGKVWFVEDRSELHNLRSLLDEERGSFHDLVGRSEAMLAVYRQIRLLGDVDSTVLIEGETGTGKELVARAIHQAGKRRNGPFIAVNCAGLTDSLLTSQLFGHRRGAFTGALTDHKGFFESAAGGTIFLDEIGDVPASVQTNLLRVLQEREILRVGDSVPRRIDVRVVTATHHDLAADVEAGTFRSDLLYRIRVARVAVPPLRERRDDIPLLVKSFLAQLKALNPLGVVDVSREALALLLEHRWPGNVRELRAATEFAVIHARTAVLQAEDFPPEVRANAPAVVARETAFGSSSEGAMPATTMVGTSARGAAAAPALPSAETLPPAPAQALPQGLPQDEKAAMVEALAKCRGKRAKAARLLGMSRSTFYRRLAEYGLAADDD